MGDKKKENASEEFNIEDYELFDQAIKTARAANKEIDIKDGIIEQCKKNLNNENYFYGPLCDTCIDGFTTVFEKITNIINNLDTIEQFLMAANAAYLDADDKAKKAAQNQTIGFEGNKLVISSVPAVGTAAAVVSNGNSTNTQGNTNATLRAAESTARSSGSKTRTSGSTQDELYNYLSSEGFNDAAICGILANIEHESSFDTDCYGDGGTSYGLCQWHYGRWDNLVEYCNNNNLDPSSVEGQERFMVAELKNSYPGVYNKLKSVPNNAEGAYDAAYEWTVNYEIPENKYGEGDRRGNKAVSQYWPEYG